MCMLDMIDLSGRIQRLKEIKITENGYPSVPTSEWPSDVESEIIEGMKDADREIMRTIEMLGMIPVLEKGNVIKKYGDRLVYLNRDVEILLNRIEDCPVDETQIIDIDDILDIDNDVFLQSVEGQERENIIISHLQILLLGLLSVSKLTVTKIQDLTMNMILTMKTIHTVN